MTSTIGDALNAFLQNARWLPKIQERRLQTEWEVIVGKTIAKYTNVNVNINVDVRTEMYFNCAFTVPLMCGIGSTSSSLLMKSF